MGLFDFLKKSGSNEDQYWEFDPANHFRPKINKADYFKLSDFDLGWLILEPITAFVNGSEQQKGKSLSYGQKALNYWWYVDGQVTNGGFVQFYFNGYGKYVQTVLKGLEHIGDFEMADLIRKADAIYKQNEKLIAKARKKDLFDSDLYEQLDDLSHLDNQYYQLHGKTMKHIEKYIKANPAEICVDENGDEFDIHFSGEYKTFYPDKQVKEIFNIKDGLVEGVFKSYFENGKLQETIHFINGLQTGEKEEYFEDGNLRYTAKLNDNSNQFEHRTYFENGSPKSLEYKSIPDNERIGLYKEWYDNGQLSKTGTYISAFERDKDWLEYYQDGSKKLKAEFKDGTFLIHDFWNEHGEHLLIDGTGLYINEYSYSEDVIGREEQEYKNYKRDGKQHSYRNGQLSLYQEMKDGKEDGLIRSYYNNGNVQRETIYQNGESVSSQVFPKSENPVGKVTFQYLMNDQWLLDKDLPTANTYPVCVNEQEIALNIKMPKAFADPDNHHLEGSTCLWLSVDKAGRVRKVDFKSAYMTNGQEFMAVADKMRFRPAMKDGVEVASYMYVIANFNVE
ncbi:DUF4375 domain-containing protein [Dyadobacter sp. CY261]|uniref:DMP19 family protein n=1 Tax=Dyadobacter sp. CY261 TaxID=2907203 RepID=UPI001F264E9E|nr:DUF4375 domain-containing protein [Dyadobacter sp. CY261]MCF0072248.1 DUF4375 domain-containing protein [Dyadobacter sp. CY261]